MMTVDFKQRLHAHAEVARGFENIHSAPETGKE
jgi:hypothetical protein